MNEQVAAQVAQILIDTKAISFRFDPPFTYTSGLKSPIYLDNRVIMSYPDKRKRIVAYYLDLIAGHVGDIDYISATATAAIPQGAWIADKLNLPLVYARSSKKAHGKENQIEGYFKKGSRVVIVEDHISTAGSSVENAKAIRALGGIVEHVVATTTYETQTSKEMLTQHGLQLYTLTTGKQIVKQAQEHRVLNSDERKMVDTWFENPSEWAK